MRYLAEGAFVAIWLYIILLFGRLGFQAVTHYARGWKPHGLALLLHEACYVPTDPPVRALRRLIPPIDLGGIRFDVAVPLLILGLSLASGLLLSIRGGLG